MTADELFRIRENMDMTQQQFAEAIGMKHAMSVSQMECGRKPITERTVKMIDLLQRTQRNSK